MTLPRGEVHQAVDRSAGHLVKIIRLVDPATYLVEAPDGSRWYATLETRLVVIGPEDAR